MKNAKFALGVYTVYDGLNSDIKDTFLRVKQMGYQGVEVFRNPVYDALEVREALSVSGLELIGWQTDWALLHKDTIDATIAYSKYVGNPYIIICMLGGEQGIGHIPAQECEQVWIQHAQELNRVAQKLRRHGLMLGYHTHEHELLLNYNGQTVLDIFCSHLDPDIKLELDTGNAVQAGADPAAYIRKYAQRSHTIHVKPYSHALGLETMIGDKEDDSDWPAILNAAKDSAAQWLVVEYYAKRYPPFEAAKLCLDRLTDGV